MLSTTFRYFHEVARTGSIRKAAQSLNISASAVSRQIAQLEHELGLPLIERLARGVRLTQAGRLVGEHLHQSFISEELMRAKLSELSGTEIGKVQIAAVEGALSYLLPTAIKAFSPQFSRIEVDVQIAGADAVAQIVRDDDAEIGVVFQPGDLSRLDICAEVMAPFCAILPATHPFAGKQVLEFSDLADLPLILNDRTFSARTHVEQAARDAGLEMRASVMVNSIEGAKSMVGAGLGVAFMPRFGAAVEVSSSRLVAVPMVDEALYDASLKVVTREGRQLSRSAAIMQQILIETVSTMKK